LVDTLDLGSSALTGVGVRVPPFVLSYLKKYLYITAELHIKKRRKSEHFC